MSPSDGSVRPTLAGIRMLDAVALVALVVAIAFAVYQRSTDYESAAALNGFSPTTLMDSFWSDPAFVAQNYPGGEDEPLRSIVNAPLPLAGALGIPKTWVFVIFVTLEMAVLAAGTWFAATTLNLSTARWQAIVTALMLVCGTLVSANLARWGHPFFGTVYNFAYAAGLAGAALMIVRAPAKGAFLLGLSVAIHPILGMLFGAFAAAAMLADWGRHSLRNIAVGAVVAVVTAAPWLLLSLSNAEIGSGGIPSDLYIAVTKMMGYHWYPLSNGVLGRIAYERLLPFFGMVVLCAVYLFHDRWPLQSIERQIVAGLGVMAALAVIGIVASEHSGSPFVVKLALHRATTVILFVAALFVVPGLLRDVVEGPWWRAVPAAAILVTPFFDRFGAPLVLALALGGIVVIGGLALRRPAGQIAAVAAALAVVLVGLAWLAVSGDVSLANPLDTGLQTLSYQPVLVLTALVLAVRLVRLPLALPVVLGVAAVLWTPVLQPFYSDDQRAKANSYLELQMWTRNNTAPDAVVMPDPGHFYGWREFSARASFGNLREFLYSGWLYDSNGEVFAEGVRRFEFFGFDLREVLARDAAEPDYGKNVLPAEIQARYYAKDLSWFEEAVARFGIDYFVFDESLSQATPGLEVVYRNDNYTLRRIPPGSP